MAEYDLQNPNDISIMHAEFDMISEDEWDYYIELAEEHNMGYKNIKALKSALKKAGISKYFNDKMIRWVLSLVEELDAKVEEAEQGNA